MYINTKTGEVFDQVYFVNYLINGKYIDNMPYIELNKVIKDSLYYLSTLSYKVDYAQIYKNGILIAELNK